MPLCGCLSNTPRGNQSSINRRNGSVALGSPGGTSGRTRCLGGHARLLCWAVDPRDAALKNTDVHDVVSLADAVDRLTGSFSPESRTPTSTRRAIGENYL